MLLIFSHRESHWFCRITMLVTAFVWLVNFAVSMGADWPIEGEITVATP